MRYNALFIAFALLIGCAETLPDEITIDPPADSPRPSRQLSGDIPDFDEPIYEIGTMAFDDSFVFFSITTIELAPDTSPTVDLSTSDEDFLDEMPERCAPAMNPAADALYFDSGSRQVAVPLTDIRIIQDDVENPRAIDLDYGAAGCLTVDTSVNQSRLGVFGPPEVFYPGRCWCINAGQEPSQCEYAVESVPKDILDAFPNLEFQMGCWYGHYAGP